MNIYDSEIEFESTCCDISETEWNNLYKGAKKASGKKIRMMIKKQLPELYSTLALEFFNPFENRSAKTETHLIYVHSAIEYFLKIIK